MSGLEVQLAADLASFDGLAATVSPKIWFPNEAANFNPSIKKRKTKEEAAAKRAAKKAKFDPSLPQTVPEILASRAAESQPSEKKAVTQTSQNSGNASIEELRDRLHNKLATLSAQRKGNGAAFSNSPSPAPSNISMGGREALLQESQRNRAEAKAAKKLERKLAKDKAAKEFKAALQKAQQPPDESSSRAAKGKGKAKATQSVDEDAWEDIEAPSSITSAPVSPDAPDDSALAIPSTSTSEQPSVEAQPDDIAFSSLDFAAADSLKPVDVLPDLRRKPRKDAAQHALDRLEDREQFLSKLTPQARERAEEKDKWENATKKASGEKVLDDAARLKKMTKKAEKQKDKSRQKWQERQSEEKDKQAARQQKRTENLNKRVQAKKDRKMGIKPKKSKAGAGGGKKSQKGFEKSNSASSGGGKERGKHRGSVSLAASKGKSATKGKKSN